MVSEHGAQRCKVDLAGVLILVLVEDGLGGAQNPATDAVKSLNPCFSGGWSRRVHLLHVGA